MNNGEKIIEILIKEEHPKRIAFLPYLREMFDSMETVYLAARERGIDARIFPLEYDVLDEQMNPVMTRFDFETKEDFEPEDYDLVIIHYPYDNYNKVTRLHDRKYYAEEMVNKTKIVYIPYFCGESNTDFKVKPGPVHASYIFVDTFADYMEYRYLFPNKKVYQVGSPKMDKLTEESGDYVLIANTLVAFLKAGGKRLDDYREIIERHENVIFRPHPLMMDTLRAMRPDLLSPYCDFIRELERTGIEIDSAPEVSKTFARCYFMYADGGSLVPMWEHTGKPYKIIS